MTVLYQLAAISGGIALLVAWLLLSKDKDWMMLAAVMGMVAVVALVGLIISLIVQSQ